MYSKAQLTPEQRKKFESLASMVSKYVPISELATRGFCMMATVEWQKKHSQTVSAIGQENPQERIAVMKEIAKKRYFTGPLAGLILHLASNFIVFRQNWIS